MYHNNVLIYAFSSQIEGATSVMNLLKLSPNNISACLKGALLYGTFLLSTIPVEGVPSALITLTELNTLVSAARVSSKSGQAVATRTLQPVQLISETGHKEEFKSVGRATQ
jgi:hypothetical protein